MNKRNLAQPFARPTAIAIAAAAFVTHFAGVYADDPKPPAKAKEPVLYRLVNVTIPPDSPIRKAKHINNPPAMYIIVRYKGEQVEKYSTIRRGWDVDFESKARNQWPIWDYTSQKFYSLEIWDSNYFRDDLILSITGISGKDFQKIIYEKGSINLPKDRLVTIRFEPVSPSRAGDKSKADAAGAPTGTQSRHSEGKGTSR